MELRSCSGKHFILTIRDGLLIKARNIDSHGMPVARSKSLKDIYGSEDAKKTLKPPSGSAFDNKHVKHRNPCSLLAARKLREMKPEPDCFAPSVDDELDSDLDDSTTLSQLKHRVTKKRKFVSIDEISNQDSASVKAVEDESDLAEPLINLKLKHSKATRAKRRRMSPSVVCPAIITVAIKSEENLVSESYSQAGGALAPVICVKSEVLDAEELGCQLEMPLASSAGHSEVLNPSHKIHEYEREPILYVNKFEECLTNEISYDHLEDIQPIPMLSGSAFKESLGSSVAEITMQKEISDSRSSITSFSDPNADLICHSSGSLFVEDMPGECSSVCHVPDMAVDDCMRSHREYNFIVSEDKAEENLAYKLNDSWSSSDEFYSSNLGCITTSSIKENPIYMKDDTITAEEQLSTSSFDTNTRNELHSEGHTEDELLMDLDRQVSTLPLTCTDNEYTLELITSDNAYTISSPEQHQLPERLFSTRKAFSPSSQERLCLVMNSAETWNDSDQNNDSKCTGNLFENETMKSSSSLRSQVQYDRKGVNHRLPGKVQRKVITSPKHNIKKSQMAKGTLEGPRFSRTLPNLSTACTSVQGCSECAVEFSQRQMHDMESIAEKLMNELKSMKEIVEQKLLFEAYRCVSLKNDADEVKSSIKSASRTEEMARKWMSTMARDCNRFCKIMKMMPDNTSSSKDTPPMGKRKIVFSDEAGGKLFHVRFFDDDTISPASNAVEQCGFQM